MKFVNICGIPHTIENVNDPFGSGIKGQIVFDSAEIKLLSGLAKPIEESVLIHEVVHGILFHISRSDLTQDEEFVQALATAISGAFKLVVEEDCAEEE